MSYKKWTIEEEQELRRWWDSLPTDDIAKNLNRSYKSVYMKARTLKLGPNKASENSNWSKEEQIKRTTISKERHGRNRKTRY